MLVQVAEGIYQLSVEFPFGMRQMNSYIFKGEKGLTIVDTGSYSEQSIEIWKRALPAETKVEKIVLTHSHTDHIGLARWLREQFQAPVLISRLGFEEMQKYHRKLQNYTGSDTALYPFFARHGGPFVQEKAMLEQVDADYFEPDELLENGQEVELGDYVFQSLWTPGHSPDHFCFYNGSSRILLAGDHVLNEISPLIPIWSEEEGNPLRDYLESLEKVADLPVDVALPGHGSLIYDLQTRIAELRAGHEQRMQQILEGISRHGSTAGEVSQAVYRFDNMSFRHLAEFLMTLTRMLYLESEGKLRAEQREGKIVFRLVG